MSQPGGHPLAYLGGAYKPDREKKKMITATFLASIAVVFAVSQAVRLVRKLLTVRPAAALFTETQ